MQFILHIDGTERRLISKHEQALLGGASRLMFGISKHTSGDMHVKMLDGARSLEQFLADAEVTDGASETVPTANVTE